LAIREPSPRAANVAPAPEMKGQQEMPLSIVLTATERERLAVVVNNLCFYASQIILLGSPILSQRALANLAKTKNEEEALLKRLDEVAREQSDESLLRVIEDLTRLPTMSRR
jgi:hypothetical protein